MENRQGGDRKCWPLQSLQTKRICEACTSSLFPLKEEPVSTFLCTEKLALALHVTSAVFQRSSQAPYPGERCMLRISSFPLSVSFTLTLLFLTPPRLSVSLILCQYVSPSFSPSPSCTLQFSFCLPQDVSKPISLLSVSPSLSFLNLFLPTRLCVHIYVVICKQIPLHLKIYICSQSSHGILLGA